MNEDRYSNGIHPDEVRTEAEETLRLVAQLEAPAELTERVHRRLAEARVVPERHGFWSLWQPAQRLQFAAAAVLAVAVAGSMWGVYHNRTATKAMTPVASPATNPAATSGGFSNADAKRVPPTLNPIKVPPAPKKKPGAGHGAVKHGAKPPAGQTGQTTAAGSTNP